MVVSALVRLMVISLGVFWVVSFLVSRLFVFYESYTLFLGTIKDERWLLEQCESPEFFQNLRLHTDLCNEVRRNAERSPMLIALNEVAKTAHLCGRHSCAEALGLLSTPVLAAIVVTVLLAPMVLVRVVRSVVSGRRYRAHDPSKML